MADNAGQKGILVAYGIDVDAVAGWLGSYAGEDSPDDISRGLFAGEVGVPRRGKLKVSGMVEYLAGRGDTVFRPSRTPMANPRVVLVGGPGQGKSTLGQLLCQVYRAALSAGRSERSIGPDAAHVLRSVWSSRMSDHWSCSVEHVMWRRTSPPGLCLSGGTGGPPLAMLQGAEVGLHGRFVVDQESLDCAGLPALDDADSDAWVANGAAVGEPDALTLIFMGGVAEGDLRGLLVMPAGAFEVQRLLGGAG